MSSTHHVRQSFLNWLMTRNASHFAFVFITSPRAFAVTNKNHTRAHGQSWRRRGFTDVDLLNTIAGKRWTVEIKRKREISREITDGSNCFNGKSCRGNGTECRGSSCPRRWHGAGSRRLIWRTCRARTDLDRSNFNLKKAITSDVKRKTNKQIN